MDDPERCDEPGADPHSLIARDGLSGHAWQGGCGCNAELPCESMTGAPVQANERIDTILGIEHARLIAAVGLRAEQPRGRGIGAEAA